MLITEASKTLFGKEFIGHSNLQRFHIGQCLGSLVGCCFRTSLQAIDSHFDQISVSNMAVVDPSFDYETTQPSPYPAIQILEDHQCLYQPEVPYPAADENMKLLNDLGKRYATESSCDCPDPILEVAQGFIGQFDLQILPGGKTES